MAMDELLRQLGEVSQQQRTIINRLEANERRLERLESELAKLNGGLAVVLSRSEETKKKSMDLPALSKSGLSPAWRH